METPRVVPLPLELQRYHGYKEVFTITDDSDVVQDISTWSFRAMFRATRTAAAALLTLTSSPLAGLTNGGATGELTMELSAANVATLVAAAASGCVWDLEVTDGDGDVWVWFGGHVTYHVEVTHG